MQGVRTAVHQFFKGELRLPPMRTETAVTGERQALNVCSVDLPPQVHNPSFSVNRTLSHRWNMACA
jgi:hypothetical protein